jgi:putative membrane protein
MNTESTTPAPKKYTSFIIAISIILPIAVAALFFIPKLDIGESLDFLPAFHATLNGICTFVLIAAVMAIKKKNITLHKRLMTTAILLSILFLVSYVLYHLTHDPAYFGDVNLTDKLGPTDEEKVAIGGIRYVYYFVLLSHILLSVAIVPLVLVTYVRALSERFDKHRKIAKITLPLWLYVTVTGVVVYFMIAPYYS